MANKEVEFAAVEVRALNDKLILWDGDKDVAVVAVVGFGELVS